MAEPRTIAIGDIHGCVHALEALLDAIQPRSGDMLIVLGDFVDLGYESRMVIDCLIDLKERCRLICLTGNHEEMMMAARTDDRALRYWEMCGGIQTLNSYYFGATIKAVPDEHWQFIADCHDSYETANHLFVHANYDPSLALTDQQPRTLRWELLDPEIVQPHESGKTVIVGHTEQGEGEVLDLGSVRCIDTACWRYGWLTALDVSTNTIWQASRFGQLRDARQPPVGPIGKRR